MLDPMPFAQQSGSGLDPAFAWRGRGPGRRRIGGGGARQQPSRGRLESAKGSFLQPISDGTNQQGPSQPHGWLGAVQTPEAVVEPAHVEAAQIAQIPSQCC